MRFVFVFVFVCLWSIGHTQYDANCFGTRKALVHLFEWRWADIAAECERFLAPKGFCGVQISPPNEHRIVMNTVEKQPWWQRYQPVSYMTYSRSGDETAFIDMVSRCNNVGVRIYADIVLNHMAGADAGAGTGVGGTPFNAAVPEFPGVPYTSDDFNQKGKECSTSSGNIENYGDANQVRNCRLVGLTDLNQGKSNVRQKLTAWLNKLISYGVAGFRFDASKHMWPADIKAIADGLNTLPTKWFSAGAKPFVYQEVIDLGGEPIKSSDYYATGRITEFNYGKYLSEAFQNKNQLKNLKTFGEGWGYLMPDNKALVFIDNHDNQRGHGAGGDILNFFKPRQYKMAVTYMLAWPYGVARVMSSYYWDRNFQNGKDQSDWIGPPSDSNYNTKPVTINSDGSCGNGWVCEHRWKPITNMAHFRSLGGSEPVANWWDDGDYQIAFSRGSKAFYAVNAGSRQMSLTLQTGLPSGYYCDIISGEPTDDSQACTGKVIAVGADGKAAIQISSSADEPMVAIHIDSKIDFDGEIGEITEPPTLAPVPSTTPSATVGWKRTIILLYKQTNVGQDVFLRGGISSSRRPACQTSSSSCEVPIRYSHVSYTAAHYASYNAWSVGDTRLDWAGAQSGQGTYSSQAASGSPMVWTTNSPTSDPAYNTLNIYGQHYWFWDVEMDCSSTDDGWFELKGFLSGAWETDIRQTGACTGGLTTPFTSNNHIARCGAKNVFRWGESGCEIHNL